ncbi:hypothetical protein MRX96_014930 [Rhipicephalus microplus]
MDMTTDADYLVYDHRRAYYLALFAFLAISTVLKIVQRHIRVPYTLVVFVVAAGCTTLFALTSKRGINNYIFRRCHMEIMFFSLGTFGITLAVATVFVTHKIADSTWPFRECLLFGLYMSCVERLPMSDALFEEGY